MNKEYRMKPSRRKFVCLGLAAASGLFLKQRPLQARMLDVNNPTAKALGYVEDAKDADKKRFPSFEKGQVCDNCNLYGRVDRNKGTCTLFPNQWVTAKGWCASWIPKS